VQHLPQITLTFECSACRQVIRRLELLSRRIKETEGVRSVMTEFDGRGQQRMIVYTDELDHSVLLRRMAAELRKPVEEGTLSSCSRQTAPSSLTGAHGLVIQLSPARGIATEQNSAVKDRLPGVVTRLRKGTYGVLAMGSIAMAWVGLLVPGIPTVPFVILAATFAAKASHSIHERIKRARVFGPMIRDWEAHGAVQPIVRLQAAVATLLIVAFTVVIAQPSPSMLLVIGIMCSISLVLIARLPVIAPEPIPNDSPQGLTNLPAVA